MNKPWWALGPTATEPPDDDLPAPDPDDYDPPIDWPADCDGPY